MDWVKKIKKIYNRNKKKEFNALVKDIKRAIKSGSYSVEFIRIKYHTSSELINELNKKFKGLTFDVKLKAELISFCNYTITWEIWEIE